MKHLVIGLGEVGAALRNVLKCEGHDLRVAVQATGEFDVIHICFPHSADFKSMVESYRVMFHAKHIVIHSTVPIGTCKDLKAIHSPVRGRHPNLTESIKQFTKYLAGPNANLIAADFSLAGIACEVLERSEDSEAGKLLDLMQYGASIMLNKEIWKFCKDNGIDFDIAYKKFNETYNRGYRTRGERQFVRPILDFVDGPIGGHCVVSNMKHLKTKTAEEILKANTHEE